MSRRNWSLFDSRVYNTSGCLCAPDAMVIVVSIPSGIFITYYLYPYPLSWNGSSSITSMHSGRQFTRLAVLFADLQINPVLNTLPTM